MWGRRSFSRPAHDSQKDDADASAYAKNLAKTILSNVAMMLAVIIYVVGGAFLFIAIEGGLDKKKAGVGANRSRLIEDEIGYGRFNCEVSSQCAIHVLKRIQRDTPHSTQREDLAHSLWASRYSPEWKTTVKDDLQKYHDSIATAIEDYGYKGKKVDVNENVEWTFASALLFTVSVVTTIGYGNVCPVTEAGQLVLIIYALIGIPLMLMFLANIGDAMAKFFRTTYGRGCCYCCNKRRIKEYKKGKGGLNASVADSDGKRPRSAWSEDYKDGGSARKRTGKRSARDSEPGDLSNTDDVIPWTDIPPEMLEPPDDAINVPISLTLVVISAYIMIGAIIFAQYNEWSWITGAYFSFVTLSTIGFGDLVPGWKDMDKIEGKLKLALSAFYIILGLAVLSMSFNLMMEETIEKFRWLAKKLGITDDDDMLEIEPTPVTEPDIPITANDTDNLVK